MKATHPAITLFTELLVPSPSGAEEHLAALVRGKIVDAGYRAQTDPAGNVLVEIPGEDPEGPLVCLAAHMDEICMVVTGIGPDGSLAVHRSGGLMPWKLGEGPVDVLGDRETLTGVLSMGSTHRSGAAEQAVQWEDCRIMTGLTPDRLAAAGVRPGTYAVPARARRGPVIFGDPTDPLVGAWTFDDRIGVVTLLRLLESLQAGSIRPKQPLLVAFTVSEEINGHGAKALVRARDPQVFIAVDGAPMPPGTALELDGRPAIWAKDSRAQYDRKLLADLSAAAENAGTALQPVVYRAAASDASMAAESLGVPRIACVGHVRENSHGYEVLRLSVLDHLLNTLVEFVRTWDAQAGDSHSPQ